MKIKKIIISIKDKNKIDKLLYYCNINAQLQKTAYIHLKYKTIFSYIIFILSTSINGIIELLNYRNLIKNNNDLMLIMGILQLIISLLMILYKNSEIDNNVQKHYDFYKQFSLLFNKLNMEFDNYDTNLFLYKDINCMIKYYYDELQGLYMIMPPCPIKILEKQKRDNLCFDMINSKEFKFDIYNFVDNNNLNDKIKRDFREIFDKTNSSKKLLNRNELYNKYKKNEIIENEIFNKTNNDIDSENIEVFLINNNNFNNTQISNFSNISI